MEKRFSFVLNNGAMAIHSEIPTLELAGYLRILHRYYEIKALAQMRELEADQPKANKDKEAK